ncbi:MAG: beta-lactamase family protein [Acidobacteriota bacterium]|nr:beta-lactamase family protein [Acidobacteriota bacterium]
MRLFISGFILTISFILVGPCVAAQNRNRIKRLDGSTISSTEIERIVAKLTQDARVTGMSIAILNDSRAVYVKSFGFRNKEGRKPLTENTVMYGASFTKAVFAYMVMQLTAEGVLDLDKPVHQYLDRALPEYEKYKDLAHDERYKLITSRMLLSHTAGFPNWRWINPDGKLDIKFTPGSKYSYSGEGINLVQFVIEAITKQSVGVMMRDRVFKPFGMTRTSMIWEERFDDDYAIGYDEKEQPLGHKRRTSARAAGSMDTTITDYARFMEAVMQGKGVTKQAQEMMLTPQIQIHSKQQFPTPSVETTDENKPIQLSYGLGWGLFYTRYGKAYFKEGHDDGWENHSVAFPDKKIAIVLMSNSSNGDSVFKELLEVLIRDRFTPWKWEGYIPHTS